jgi:tetratricopeptide (TPR) repeat protein
MKLPHLKTTPIAIDPEAVQARWVCVFLVLPVLAVFGQTAGFEFVNFDDGKYVYENPIVQKGLTWEGVRWAFTYGEIGHWHPLTWLSHMADCEVFGLWAGGPHLVNVTLHAVSAVLLFLLLRTMTGRLWRSAFVAAVFAVHPLRAESVAWVAERKDVLSGMFFMLTLWAYVRYARQPSRMGLVKVVLLYALGLLSKNMLVTLPFVMLLLDWWPLGRMKLGPREGEADALERTNVLALVKEKFPMFLLAAGSCVATFLTPEKIASDRLIAAPERIGNALVCFFVYIQNTVVPTGLAIPYPFPPNLRPFWEIGLALAALIGVSVTVAAGRRKWPYLLVGWLWYVGMLVPVIGLVQISYYSHADRYTYLPGIGLSLAGTWAAAEWCAGWKHGRALAAGVMAAALGALMVCAFIQTSYWRDSETLWTRVLACTSSNYVAHYNLADALFKQGRVEEAIQHLRSALEIQPDSAEAHVNLGIALVKQGDLDGAIAHFQRCAEIQPNLVKPHYNMGNALFRLGRLDEAIVQYRKTLEIEPDNVEALNNLGNALAMKGAYNEAIAQYQKALTLRPNYTDAHSDLGRVLVRLGRLDEGVAQFREAVAIKPDDPVLLKDLGKSLLMKNDFAGAMACFEKTAPLGPDPLARWQLVGDNFLKQSDWDTAISCYRQAIKIDPRSADVCANLGMACFQKGEAKEAIDAWEKSLAINPDQLTVQNNLAWLLATASDLSLRNATRAVALAMQANQSSGGGNPVILHTLAVSYAAQGSYGLATVTARRALQLALEQKRDALVATLQKEIVEYESQPAAGTSPQ